MNAKEVKLVTLLKNVEEDKEQVSCEGEELELEEEEVDEEEVDEVETAPAKLKFELDRGSLDLYLDEVGQTPLLSVEETNSLAHHLEDAKHLEKLQKEWVGRYGVQPQAVDLVVLLADHIGTLESLFEGLCNHLELSSSMNVTEKIWHPDLRAVVDGQIDKDVSAAIAGITGTTQEKIEKGMVELSIDSRLMPWDMLGEAGEKSSLAEFSEALQLPQFRDQLEDRRFEMSRQFQQVKDKAREAHRRMIQSNLRLVVSVAKGHIDWGVPLLDLVQEGNIGLMQAVRKFDHRRGCRFSTYAIPWIWQAINRAANEQGRLVHLPGHVVDDLTKLSRARNNLVQKLGYQPTDKELAAETGLPFKKVESLLKVMSGVPVSLDTPVGEDGSEIGDFVPDREAMQPEEESDASLLREELNKTLETLTPREKRVIELRFGLGDDYGRTLVEVGAELGLSKERIRQIEKGALAKLRHPSHSRELIGYLG
jgi:RNA polymerase primary sigma factor